MSSYTCITCHVAFGDAEIQRSHYKTDWHRYNLKRKVAEMPPVTAENFQERVLALRSAVEEKKKGTATDCTSCGKRFATFNAYENHLKSKKHQDTEKKFTSIASKQLERLNVKNLEIGISEDGMDKDTVNIAIQQAVKAQLAPSTRKRTVVPGTEDTESQVTVSSHQNKKPDKPPRLLWFEQQAAKLDQLESCEEEVTMEDEDDGEWEDVDSVSDEEEHFKNESQADKLTEDSPPGSIQIPDCLFCSHHSRSLFKNIDHMTKMHGFFIPDIEYLVDLKGLMKYLVREKVGLGNVCLWCNEKGRSFYSTEAVQAHMVDSSHCKLFTDGDAALEFADFYDFRGSYPDHKHGEDIDMKAAEIPNKNLEYNEETMELVLPSGARIGHRSLLRYYKQHFGASRAVATTGTNTLGRVLQQYKALGWSSELAKAASQRKERDMQYVQRMKSKWMLKTALSNNATKQMHFRPQILF